MHFSSTLVLHLALPLSSPLALYLSSHLALHLAFHLALHLAFPLALHLALPLTLPLALPLASLEIATPEIALSPCLSKFKTDLNQFRPGLDTEKVRINTISAYISRIKIQAQA